MTNKETILKTIKFIELNLMSNIDVSNVAKEGCYSLHHFIRLFHSITGISPKKYLLQRRLTESIGRLLNSNEKIVDIATDFQFRSHEVFTRAFSKQFGTNPSNIRKGDAIEPYLLTRAITENYIFQSDKARNEPPELIELNEKILVGISYFISDKTKIESLSTKWGNFIKGEIGAVRNKVAPEYYYQVQYWSENQCSDGMNFFIGVEVNNIKEINPQFVIKIIPKGTYLRFIHKGLSKNVGFTYRYIYNEFLPDTDYKLSIPFNFEYYGEKYLSPNNEKSESHLFIPIEK